MPALYSAVMCFRSVWGGITHYFAAILFFSIFLFFLWRQRTTKRWHPTWLWSGGYGWSVFCLLQPVEVFLRFYVPFILRKFAGALVVSHSAFYVVPLHYYFSGQRCCFACAWLCYCIELLSFWMRGFCLWLCQFHEKFLMLPAHLGAQHRH